MRLKRNRFEWCLLLLVFVLLRPLGAAAEEGKVAVFPFKVHALKPLGHLERGMQKILTHRIENKGYGVVAPEVVNKHPMAFRPQLQTRDLLQAGGDLDANWVIEGSLTQIGQKISLDLKVVDVSMKKPPFFIFMVADDIDALSETAERVAVSVHHQIAGVAQVDSVRVRGNQRVEKEAILAVVRTKKGDRLDSEQLNLDLRDIYKMGFFEDVQTEIEDGPRGKIVIFHVVEKPSIGRIVFNGNDEIDEEDLKKELGIKLYSILDRNEIKQGAERIKEYYRQEGYYRAQVKERVEPLPNNQVLVEYRIVENEKVYVSQINFEGNKQFSDKKLRKLMETREKSFYSSWLSWIMDPGYLNTKRLQFDLHKITSFYHNHGFLKAKVGEPKIDFVPGEGLTISIEVDEGQQYGVEKVDIEGELIRPAAELMEFVRIGEEEFFNREVVRKDVLALKEIYADEGYAYAEVRPITDEKEETTLVAITYKVSQGPKVRFERINISGNTRTRDKVIRRELKMVEGEYFSGRAMKKSSQALNRLGFFEDVEVQTKKGSSEDQMVLDINIKERPTGAFSFGAGYSSVDSVVGSAQIAQDNLMGYGYKLVLAARLGGRSTMFDLLFSDPWVLERPISAAFRGFKWEREYDEYTKDSFGGSLDVSWPIERIDEYTRGLAGYRYEDADVQEVDSDASLIILDQEGRHVTSAITVGLMRNSTDRAWNATRGSINSFTVEYAGGFLGGDNYFTKYLAKSAWFFPFKWETVLMLQGRAGYIDERSGGDLPVYEKFFLGGINTIRGFDFTDVSPIDPLTGDKVGGEKMVNFNAEYRFPLIKEQGVMGVVFVDGGNVYTDEPGTEERGFATSAGMGVRWYSPIGPLRLEWGYNLSPERGEDSNQFEFSIGAIY
jgi:outer membrane protein insertion porin family